MDLSTGACGLAFELSLGNVGAPNWLTIFKLKIAEGPVGTL